jgi:hypothetical protein
VRGEKNGGALGRGDIDQFSRIAAARWGRALRFVEEAPDGGQRAQSASLASTARKF